ncbi:MAG: hypothetical protein BWY82_01305 [Verrucomicrobia bacterium ADurb.Bin474]|nr:MAG: hypothetical protein BWY82_01305 [Verrucomicrobia bacterium ADurb.Bin474]
MDQKKQCLLHVGGIDLVIRIQATNETSPRMGDSEIPVVSHKMPAVPQKDPESGVFAFLEKPQSLDRRIISRTTIHNNDFEIPPRLTQHRYNRLAHILPVIEAGNHHTQGNSLRFHTHLL